jgi:basic membrane protein A
MQMRINLLTGDRRMKTKRFFWLLLAILIVSSLALSACGGAEPETPEPVAEEVPQEVPLKIGLVTDVGEIDDKSFNQSAWEGVQLAGEEFGAEVDFVETKDAKDYMANIELFTKNDFDIVVTVGFALGEATLEAAALYPDVYFIGVDQGQWGGVVDNVAGLIFNEDKSGFMAGALAAMLTETNTVAAVLGTDLVPPVVAFKEGYEAGAAYVNPDINVLTTYHPGGLDVAFTDPEWGATTAKQALDSGADVVFGAGGKTGNGALIETAGVEGAYCIGVDSDQWFTVPEAHSCLVSSAMKLITPGVFDLVKMHQDGEPFAGSFLGAVALAPFHDFEADISQDIKDQLAEIRELLLNDELDTGYPPGEEAPAEEAAVLPDLGGQEITVAVENQYLPFNYIDVATGEAAGWDYVVWEEICVLLNCSVTFVEASWEGMIQAVADGQFDAAGDGITITEARAEIVDFSVGYISIEQRLLVRIDETRIEKIEDIVADETLKLGTQTGTTNYETASTYLPEDRISAFETFPFTVQALIAGDIDAVMIDEVAGLGYQGANADELKVIGPSMSSDVLGFIFPLGSELVDPVNLAIGEMAKNGSLGEINLEYFGPGFEITYDDIIFPE